MILTPQQLLITQSHDAHECVTLMDVYCFGACWLGDEGEPEF
jgi:hypothetical protein